MASSSVTKRSRKITNDKMLQIFYNPNSAIIVDLSCNENMLINFLITNNSAMHHFSTMLALQFLPKPERPKPRPRPDIPEAKANKIGLEAKD